MAAPREQRLRGLPISNGLAVGKVCLFNDWRHMPAPQCPVNRADLAQERIRLEQAIEVASERLAELADRVTRQLGASHAGIFVAQRMMMEDKALHAEMFDHIENAGLNAESVVVMSLDAYGFALSEMEEEYLRERAADVAEVKRRLLHELGSMTPGLRCADEAHCQRGFNRIIVAEELTPTITMTLTAEHTLGFVTEHGGTASHAAILARALGIPAVSGIKNIHQMISCGTEVLVNGGTGEVLIWPNEATLRLHPTLKHAHATRVHSVNPVPGFQVMANVSSVEEVATASAMRAEGIGLYRTEFPFLAAGRLLSEEEQFEQYATVVKAMAGHPVMFRLLDLGGDKAGSLLDLPAEENPQLGLRGSRLLLARPELLETQARALARASQIGPVSILYPMITDRDQFLTLRDMFHKATHDLQGTSGPIRHGVMIEVPAACLTAREILEVAEFASIGTNDLTQYLLAVDRNNELVAQYYTADAPVLWATIAMVVEAARETKCPLSVCGEAAGNPQYVTKLIDVGVHSVSVTPRLIPEVRRAARHSLEPTDHAAPAHTG